MHFPTAPGDYTTTSGVHLFNASLTVPVPLQIDYVYEAVETFFADLQLQTSPLNVVIDHIASRADLLIIDNNRKNLKKTVLSDCVYITSFSLFFYSDLIPSQVSLLDSE